MALVRRLVLKILKSHHIFIKYGSQQTVRLCTTNAACCRSRNIHDNGIYVGNNGAGFKSTVGAVFEKWLKKFEENSISEPRESIEHILAHCLITQRLSDIDKFKNRPLSEAEINEIDSLCEKRLMQLPVQYVLGEWSFRNLILKMRPPVFIPRPETEELVDIVSAEIARKGVNRVLDLCCGSGAISLSLLQEHPPLEVVAVDRSEAACRLTEENAGMYGLSKRLRVVHSRLEELKFAGKWEVIVSNPPYVFSEDLASLQAEIKYEDLRALDGGENGLDIIKIIIKISSEWLVENGKLFLEVEPRHPGLLQDYLLAKPSMRLAFSRTFRDFAGKERFVEITKV